jgi:hypothetical protein
MNHEHIERGFEKIGARVAFGTDPSRFRWIRPRIFLLDIRTDRKGEYFDIQTYRDAPEIEVIDVRPSEHHLLLLVRDAKGAKAKYLCGHDERHWFVAAIPELAPVGTVRQAKEALKPREVMEAQSRECLGAREQGRRKTRAYIRQGEWFFVPALRLQIDDRLVLRDEPLTRGGKPHLAEYCYRAGGEKVYVCSSYPWGLLEREYRALILRSPAAKAQHWEVRRRNAMVYVRGTIRHPDHKTVRLHGWHRVVPNTEGQASAMKRVLFID